MYLYNLTSNQTPAHLCTSWVPGWLRLGEVLFLETMSNEQLVEMLEPMLPEQRFQTFKRWLIDEGIDSLGWESTSYKEFLDSYYWKIIRDYLIWKHDGVCFVCGSDYRLHVHHISYLHRGFEYLYPGDLTVLCKVCHETVHGIRKFPRRRFKFDNSAINYELV